MNVQLIEKDGKPEWAVIPYETYRLLVEQAEMLADVVAYDEAKESLREGEALIPAEVVYALAEGAHPVRVWREHRGLTQRQLAEAAGISAAYLSQIESGTRQGSAEVLAALAQALNVPLDDLMHT